MIKLVERVPRAFLVDQFLALVGLGILSGVTAQARHAEPQQSGSQARTDVADHFVDESGSFGWIGAVAIPHIKVRERMQIFRNVASRSLAIARNRQGVAIVFDVKKQRQSQGGGDSEGGPES